MAHDRRFHFTPFQVFKVVLFGPPIALYVLIKTCVVRLLLGRQRSVTQSSGKSGQWDIVCISHVSWRHIRQRNHHTMAQLARRSKVLYINPIRLDTYCKHTPHHLLQFRKVCENIWHHEIFVLPFETQSPLFQRLNRFLLETRIRYHMKRLGFGPIVLWFYFPSQRWLTGCLGERAVVYDIQDEYSQFPWAPRDTAEKENQLLAEADVVFAGTDALYERKRPQARNNHFFGCGVDYDHFNTVYYRDRPREFRHLRGKVTLGYFGALDNRIDRDLLLYLSRERPDWNLVMIGPIVGGLFKRFSAPNVAFTGTKPYELLPRYLALFDVCLMPFVMSDMTRHINPTKALEYFASGKPVVSTPIPDMVKHYSDVIYFGSTPDEFLAQCETCLADFPADRRERGLHLAREKSWESVVTAMRQLIDEAIARKGS